MIEYYMRPVNEYENGRGSNSEVAKKSKVGSIDQK